MPASNLLPRHLLAQTLNLSTKLINDIITITQSGFQNCNHFTLSLILRHPEVNDIITLGMLAHHYPLVRSDHICANVGTVGRILRLRCSAANCLGVNPAHTPCMSPEGNDSA